MPDTLTPAERRYVLCISDPQTCRVLVGLRITDDGKLVAEYDPADLDEAARELFEFIARHVDLDKLLNPKEGGEKPCGT
jgi:hypothetical protein